MSCHRLLLIAITCWPLLATAGGDDAYFELTDGSVVTGELLGLDEGGFRVRTATLGELTINESQVRVMRRGPPPAPDPVRLDDTQDQPPAGTGIDPSAVAAMQQRLTGDPAIMGMIMALQNDPDLSAALSDPSLLQTIASGNLESLRNDPRLQKLMGHPAIRAIIERMGGQ